MYRKKRSRSRNSRRASQFKCIEASLAAAQNKHDADAACRMCPQGQASQQQSPTPPLRKGKTRAACISIINNQDLDRANHIHQPAPPAIKAHQPSSAQCIFAAQAHPDTQPDSSSSQSLQSIHTPQQPNKTLLCPAAGASATRNMTCHPPSDLSPLCHRSKLKTQTLSLSQRPHLAFEFLRVYGTHFSGPCVAYHISSTRPSTTITR